MEQRYKVTALMGEDANCFYTNDFERAMVAMIHNAELGFPVEWLDTETGELLAIQNIPGSEWLSNEAALAVLEYYMCEAWL